MGRNLIICCDGTNNEFGPENTSVVRLIQVLDRDPEKQRLYYDPGVGTLPEPGLWTRIGKKASDLLGLIIGAGLGWKIQEAYEYLMEMWEPGDEVYLFGFSRGAYSVRVLAGFLHVLGLLPRGATNMVPYAFRLYSEISKYNDPRSSGTVSKYWQLCDEFRRTFSRESIAGDQERRFPVHFLGVWDTVSSVGWFWEPVKYQSTARNPSIGILRHALAIDERRWFFRQNQMTQVGTQDLDERWFPGVHSDVGGGYPESDGGLWRRPFEWMLGEAAKAGLVIDSARLQTVLTRSAISAKPWTDQKHESLHGWWWLAEYFPKWRYQSALGHSVLKIGRGRRRTIAAGALMDNSALLRLHDDEEYKPPNLSESFREKIRPTEESQIPGVLPYVP